ncbi:transient receptor potential cation channel protein painless-like [Toxorhynchites rutilus septentrionalis]|uniref:transient receptor potential cation channel protein painless-like n=1 Tax=Toxorhynchites rutilus septentrionalis TaxID=329112 RepID=UPI00247A7FAD|nr:transient receptor potential cation channel protein painless-like [Toxorhynchites rutilus septentrionalis]
MNNANNMQLLCAADPQRGLAAALAGRNLEQFQFALSCGADPNVRDESSGFTVFEHACQTAGTDKFILECIKYGADVQLPNTNGKYPIHLVAFSQDPANVQALLENSEVDIDVLYQGQTPLHILFESINEENWNNVFNCITLIIEKGADINIPNDENRTSIGVFVKNSKHWQKKSQFWRRDILLYCLEHTVVDVDSFRKGELRNKLTEYFPDIQIPVYTMDTNLNVLLSLLKSRNDAKFDFSLKQYREKIRDDAAWNNDLKILLEAAVHSGKLSLVKKLTKDDDVFGSDSNLPNLLSLCCHYGYHDILSFLLSKTGNTKSDIQLINSISLLSLVIKEINVLKDISKCPFFKCLKILLDDGRIYIDKTDEKGCSALHYAVKYKVDSAVDILLENSAYIGTSNMFKELPICEMNSDVLEQYLDSCITTNEKRPGDDDYEIKIDFSCLVPPIYKKNFSADTINNTNTMSINDEMLPIVYMANSTDLKHLLKHPVISSFVLIKWLRLSIYFYVNLVICTIFFLSFTGYVVGCYGQENVARWLKELLRMISLLGTTYMALREIGQMILHVKMYFFSIENWMEITLIIASYTVLLKEFQNEFRQMITAVVILLSAIEFTLLVGTLPVLSISTHMVMLKTVSKNFLKSLVLYSIILISFAFCFYTLFNVNNVIIKDKTTSTPKENKEEEEDKFNAFADIGNALLKTVVMLTGEFEAANIKFQTNSISYLIFVLYLFFVAIVIFNLMNGLAVNDTAAIKAEAELIGLSQKVDVISKYENAVKLSKTNGVLTKIVFYIFPTTFLQLFPDYMPFYNVIVAPNQSNKIFIPRPKTNVNTGSVMDVESHIELLPNDACYNENFKLTIGCCVLPTFSRMDNKIMKYAKEILHSRNKRKHLLEKGDFNVRLSKIERDIDRILGLLNNMNTIQTFDV